MAHDILAAFDDAINDGVDIITISIGLGFMADVYGDAISIGAFHAMENGILTTNSAGNNGPLDGTVSSPAPWILTVAASSIDRRIIDKDFFGIGTTVVVSLINFTDKLVYFIAIFCYILSNIFIENRGIL